MSLPLIRVDRANHAVYGAVVGLAALLAAHAFPGMLGHTGTNFLPVAAAVVAGAVKEISDHLTNAKAMQRGYPPPHAVERADFAWTVFGGLLITLGRLL